MSALASGPDHIDPRSLPDHEARRAQGNGPAGGLASPSVRAPTIRW